MATLPLVSETEVKPSKVEVGVLSEGQLDSSLAELLDGKPETSMIWSGPQVELVFTFDTIPVINRLRLELDTYQGLTLVELTSTADGIYQEDLLPEIPASGRSLDGSSNKFSGDVVLDFDARQVRSLRIVLADRVGDQRIALRGASFYRRRYQSSGVAQSKMIEFPELGLVRFGTEQWMAPTLTSIVHQISCDGAHYLHIVPGQIIDLGGRKCWYRAAMERLDSNFKEDLDPPVEDPGLQPQPGDNYSINSVSTQECGANIVERTLLVDLLAPNPPTPNPSKVRLWETPLANTLSVYQGAALLGPEQYQLEGQTLLFYGPEERMGLTIRYQVPFRTKGALSHSFRPVSSWFSNQLRRPGHRQTAPHPRRRSRPPVQPLRRHPERLASTSPRTSLPEYEPAVSGTVHFGCAFGPLDVLV